MADDVKFDLLHLSCREVITCEPTAPITNVAPVFNVNSHQIDKSKLEDSMKTIADENEATLLSLSHSTYRTFLCKVAPGTTNLYVGGSGQVIPVAPGLYLSCNHVVNTSGVVARYCSNNDTAPYNLVNMKAVIPMGKVLNIDKDYLDTIACNDRDPITGKRNDVIDFDLTLVESTEPVTNIIYPDPLSSTLSVGDVVAAFHHPGIANVDAMSEAISSVYGDISVRPTYKDLTSIFTWSQKSISFGKVLPQTFAYADSNIAVSTCNLIAGSSSAFIHRIGAPAETFTGVHVGGGFVHCVDCLAIPPTARKCPDTRHTEAQTSCTSCRASGCKACVASRGKNLKDSYGYNYFYQVHHPAFVALYAKYVFPQFTSVPSQVVSYLKANRSVLNEHKNWIGSHINPYL